MPWHSSAPINFPSLMHSLGAPPNEPPYFSVIMLSHSCLVVAPASTHSFGANFPNIIFSHSLTVVAPALTHSLGAFFSNASLSFSLKNASNSTLTSSGSPSNIASLFELISSTLWHAFTSCSNWHFITLGII